jgi:hypothetical protein
LGSRSAAALMPIHEIANHSILSCRHPSLPFISYIFNSHAITFPLYSIFVPT